jgi:hypothetical protein
MRQLPNDSDRLGIRSDTTLFLHRLLAIGVAGCSLWLAGCQTTPRSQPIGRVEHTGLLAGFPEGKVSNSGETLYFEPSALLRNGDDVLIANDKPLPGLSTVLSVPLKEFSRDFIKSDAVTHVKAAAFENSSKLESLAAAPEWGFAASDFDRITMDSPENDTYNNLLAWPAGRPEQARVVCASERGGVVSSRGLRTAFVEALKSAKYPDGPPYFKIEGLASPDPKTLIFGVREIGATYEDQEYCFKLVRATIQNDANSGVTLSRPLEKILDFRPVIPERPGIKLGLSSLEFDPELQVFVAVTSYEQGENIGAFFWVFSAADLAKGVPPRLVRDAAGKPLALAHKGEGLVSLGGGRFLVICDDDQVIKPIKSPGGIRMRRPNEAVYFVIRLDLAAGARL